jgi:hypothetical protein
MSNQNEALLARIADLEAQVAKSKTAKALTLKVSPKGAVSLYGMGRFPVTLYASQWEQVLSEAEKIKSFLEKNKSVLAAKA